MDSAGEGDDSVEATGTLRSPLASVDSSRMIAVFVFSAFFKWIAVLWDGA